MHGDGCQQQEELDWHDGVLSGVWRGLCLAFFFFLEHTQER